MSTTGITTKPKETTKTKETKSKVGDKVKFFDEQNREFKGVLEKINPDKTATIRVSRIPGHSQTYLSVSKSSKNKIKPRYN